MALRRIVRSSRYSEDIEKLGPEGKRLDGLLEWALSTNPEHAGRALGFRLFVGKAEIESPQFFFYQVNSDHVALLRVKDAPGPWSKDSEGVGEIPRHYSVH